MFNNDSIIPYFQSLIHSFLLSADKDIIQPGNHLAEKRSRFKGHDMTLMIQLVLSSLHMLFSARLNAKLYGREYIKKHTC